MTDTKMNFKDALIAHLQDEKVEAFASDTSDWVDFGKCFDGLSIGYLKSINHSNTEFRLAPRTVMCNGVEVPAPESVSPAQGTVYYTPHVTREPGYNKETWDRAAGFDLRVLEHGLVYLKKEDAIARAKAMLITK